MAADIIPVGKETDRRWEQGEDMGMLDFQVLEYRANGNMVLADETLRDQIAEVGMREMMRRNWIAPAHA